MSLEEELKCNKYSGFAAFYDAYAPALYGILYRSAGDEGLAALLLQEVFVELRAKIRQDDHFGCSIFMRAIRLCRSKVAHMVIVNEHI